MAEDTRTASQTATSTLAHAVDDRGISAFRPLRTRSLAETVVAVIVDAIRGGLYEPGDKLPRARDLAAALEVSGAVIREATGILDRAGIVSVRRGAHGGTFVKTRWIPQEVAAEIAGETYANMKALLEVRRLLETQAALLAGERHTPEDIEALRRLADKLPELLDDAEELLAVDLQFHVRIAEASGNPVLAQMVRDTIGQYMTERAVYPVGHVALQRAIQNQLDTVQALVDGDPERIARSIDTHLASAEEYFLGARLKPVEFPHVERAKG